MIDKWISKMKPLFRSKEKPSKRDVGDQQNKTSVHAKVSYEYPKKHPFPFPMPVDQPTGHEELPNELNKRTHHISEPKEHQVAKKTPFRPSDVASPIHGFQSEDELDKEELDKPAFLRRDRDMRIKERAVETDIELQSDNNNEEQFKAQAVNETRDEEIKTEQSQQHRLEINDEIIAESSEEQLNEQHEQSTARKKRIGHQREKRPFNVIMTPSDKRHLQQRKQQKKQRQPEHNQEFPSLQLLNQPTRGVNQDQAWITAQSKKLTETLAEFNVNAHVVNAMQGPTVTQFEIKPETGVKVSKIRNLSDDIKLNMAAQDIRIEAPIPGKNTIGIEIPNKIAAPVSLYEILNTRLFSQGKSPLTIGLGLDISGSPVITDIKKMPHGLIAGATGSGKSVCINTILTSLIYKATPEEVRLLLIDPKMVELAPYNEIPHLVSPVITDVKAATQALKWAVEEMEDRYQKFVSTGSRDIERYNQKMIDQNKAKEKMPYLIIVIDELADLMMMAPQDVEESISRIAQKARACGIHLLLATQRPSVDVITGLIKANIPTRIAFSVASQVDSRTMIDQGGAERLLGKGDMLFVESGARYPVRIQGAFVSDEEIDRITADARKRQPVDYLFQQEDLLQKIEQDDNEDDLYEEVVAFVLDHNRASTSLIQRRFKMGYNRAARLIDTLEGKGIISGQNGSKPRTVLITKEEYQQSFLA